MTSEERTLEVAGIVADALAARGVRTAVIGAVASAIRNYPRATEDLDLATFVHPGNELQPVCNALRAQGFDATLEYPDPDDSLGGVRRVVGPDFQKIEVVNFYNPMGKVAKVGGDAIDDAEPNALGRLAVVRLPYLIALKLYSVAGSLSKGHLDVMELLDRNPDIDIAALRKLCEEHGLARELDAILERRT